MTLVQLPPSASLERTDKVITTMTDYFMNKEKDNVDSIFTVSVSHSLGSVKMRV